MFSFSVGRWSDWNELFVDRLLESTYQESWRIRCRDVCTNPAASSEIQIRAENECYRFPMVAPSWNMKWRKLSTSRRIYKAGLAVDKHDQLTHRISRDYRFQQQTRHDLCGIWPLLKFIDQNWYLLPNTCIRRMCLTNHRFYFTKTYVYRRYDHYANSIDNSDNKG